MSLINEALKKAQRQRSLESAPLSSAPSGVAAAAVTTHVRSASHKRSYAGLWFAATLVGLGAATTALVMRFGFVSSDTPPPVPAVPAPSAPVALAAPPPAAVAAPAPAVTTPATVVLPPMSADTPSSPPARAAAPSPSVTSAATEPPARATISATPPAAPAPSTQSPSPAPAAPPATPAPAPVPVAPVQVAPVPAAPSAAEHDAQVYAFINTLRLTGVRGVGREARVLMNERVWRLNDVVSPELGLRLSSVRPNLLVFTDAKGRTYEKPY